MLSAFKTGDRVFYGWVIVAAIIANGFILMGVNSSFGVFFKSIEETFGLTRATTSGILSVRMAFGGVFAVLGGWSIDRYGPRVTFSVMGLFIGVSLVLTGLTTDAWQLFITYGFLVSVGVGASYVVMTATVLRWFDKKRGLALGLAGVGPGVGTAVISPLSASLIDRFDWRNTSLILGVLSWLVMLPAATLLKRGPQAIGALPDGAGEVSPAMESKESPDVSSGSSLLEALKTRNFWAFFMLWLTMAFSSFFVFTHMVPHSLDIGYSSVESATILSVMGISMIFGRLGAGIITDKVSAKGVAVISTLIQMGAVLGLVWARELWMLYLFGLVHGISFGGFGTSVTLLIGRTFNVRGIGKILGALEVGIFVGGAFGPYLGGLIFDTTGSYNIAFVIMAVITLLRIPLVALVRSSPAQVQTA